MCTVTALPRSRLSSPGWAADPLLLRLVCNRDELRTRPDALPPIVHTIDGRRAIMPLDPESGGTWIAVNDNGLVLALLNANAHVRQAPGGLSRGSLIPALASATSSTEALTRLFEARAERYRPFRLLMLDSAQFVECWMESGRLRYRRSYLHGVVMRTSSSLGDAVVEAPRRTLFRRFFRGTTHAAAAQDAFHDHQWRGREDVSVWMERADARTVSRTTIEVTGSFATMIYQAADADVHARVVLPLTGALARLQARCS